MHIIKADLADAAELTNLINSAYRGESSKKGWTSEAHLLEGIRIDEPTLTEYLQTDDTIILKNIDAEGKITACVYLQQRDNNRLYLGMLTVSPTLQAKGTGRKLLHEAELWAAKLNCSQIFMTVISTRTELLSWYMRRGYQNTGKIIPFPVETGFGEPKELIELVVLEKNI